MPIFSSKSYMVGKDYFDIPLRQRNVYFDGCNWTWGDSFTFPCILYSFPSDGRILHFCFPFILYFSVRKQKNLDNGDP